MMLSQCFAIFAHCSIRGVLGLYNFIIEHMYLIYRSSTKVCAGDIQSLV